MQHLHTVGLLAIRQKKLLLAYSRNKNCFYLPGGKLDAGESPIEGLCREIGEELGVWLGPADMSYYIHISAPAFGEKEGTMMEQDCFLLLRDVEPRASAEIGALRHFSLHEYLQEPTQAPGAVMILEELTKAGLIE